MMISEMLDVYFIAGTQDVLAGELLPVLEDALKSGVTCFQFREKKLTEPAKIESLAKSCQEICRKYQVPFFVNDDVKLALKIGADGVHVGQEDMAISKVIASCAGKMKIGLSVNTLEQADEAASCKALDYIGVGPIFATISKADAKPVTGLKLLQEIRDSGVTLPIVAIGGITPERAKWVRESGAQGMAVISAITKSENRRETVAAFQ
ncbi:thiamine-phosphate pyrophosphorylase [Listeria weihenstephanensis FSL R9-0317]|uniref:Thiamine-phosphate synthase n=1 Tax=Listeria weihenstephanensis TaxID=1006155 RepID=A0A1S7FY08_9LIST|nr:thiamine-phosphate pyrophosphorylase [Listeria weihenstephanensis]EUJ35357.1 thiamine-phosphate pyrophosphorylase [Listeria weihenstephanensis FSL R9-0317]